MATEIKERTRLKVVLSGDGADESQMGNLHQSQIGDLEVTDKLRHQNMSNVHLFNGLGV
jgi:asparagine synthetase B (glutamine-hydrolysing)